MYKNVAFSNKWQHVLRKKEKGKDFWSIGAITDWSWRNSRNQLPFMAQ
jgi:hypothetical protein